MMPDANEWAVLACFATTLILGGITGALASWFSRHVGPGWALSCSAVFGVVYLVGLAVVLQ
jgi:hypothetical protein